MTEIVYSMPVTVGPSTLTINHDRQFLVCQPDATMSVQDDVGFYSLDTRFVSGYAVTINGRRPILLDAIAVNHFAARHEFMTPELPLGPSFGGAREEVIPERSIGFRLERNILEGVHEDYDLVNYAPRPVRVVLEVGIESDFADIFDVRNRSLVRRGDLQSTWRPRAGVLKVVYHNRSFRRGLLVKVERSDSRPEFANGRIVFVAELPPKTRWHTCILWLPVLAERSARVLSCGGDGGGGARMPARRLPPVELVSPEHATLPAIWRQAASDMEALRMEDTTRRNVFVPAAGIPWFVTLFGRDSLIVSIESISGFPEFALGALQNLARVQATSDDPEQDKEPGKSPHEIRSGELATLGLLPFAPYFGTHDATPLFLIVLSYAYQWSGDVGLLKRYRRSAEAALAWLQRSGDRDGDGFQEYLCRSSHGIANQGWKDSWDAIQHADGSIPRGPIALCELQGYAFDATLRMAEIYDLLGEPERGESLRGEARRLYDRFNEDFWWEAQGTYYLGLDGDKRPIETVASNAGHCLASGIAPPDRARQVVDRLMAPDMWSGWRPHPFQRASRLQPLLLPLRIDLAPRLRHDRGRVSAGRPARRGAAGGGGHLRRGRALRLLPPAGAVRRPAARPGRLPRALPGSQRSSGLGRCRRLPPGRHPLRHPHRGPDADHLRQPAAPGLASVPDSAQPAGGTRGPGTAHAGEPGPGGRQHHRIQGSPRAPAPSRADPGAAGPVLTRRRTQGLRPRASSRSASTRPADASSVAATKATSVKAW